MKFPKIPYWPLLSGPTILFGVGFLMNAIAVGVNHGQMPVQYPGGSMAGFSSVDSGDVVHCAMTAATHLKVICDWILINGVGIASPGDCLEWAFDATVMPCLYAWAALMIADKNK
jgi:hypothetical protein